MGTLIRTKDLVVAGGRGVSDENRGALLDELARDRWNKFARPPISATNAFVVYVITASMRVNAKLPPCRGFTAREGL